MSAAGKPDDDPAQDTAPQRIARLWQAGRREAAIDAAMRGVQEHPADADRWMVLGMISHEAGVLETAVVCYRRVAEIRPGFADAHFNLGVAMTALGERGAAAAHYRDALAADSGHAEAAFNLGNLMFSDEDLPAAGHAYAAALRADDGRADAWHNLAKTLHAQGRWRAAAALCRQAAKRHPGYRPLLLLQAVILMMDPLSADCTAALDDALRKTGGGAAGGDTGWLWTQKAIIAWLSGDPATCRRHLSRSGEPGTEAAAGPVAVSQRIYKDFLGRLLDFREAHRTDYPDRCDRRVYLVGDSHCLSPAFTALEISGHSHQVLPRLILGAKAFHLGSEAPNQYTAALDLAVAGMPEGAEMVAMFGEIDCRMGEGIFHAWKKHGGDDAALIELSARTVDDYMAALDRRRRSSGIRLAVAGVPAPAPTVLQRVPAADIAAFLSVPRRVNARLAHCCARLGWPFIDLYELTSGADGRATGNWHLDDYHLMPTALSAARTHGMRSSAPGGSH